MPYNLVIFSLGLIGLWLGAELINRSAIALAKLVGLSETFIGLTIVAIGTDLPEITVAIEGAIEQARGLPTTDLVLGNIIGSNMGNVGVVLVLAGMLRVLRFTRREMISNGLMMVGSALAFWVLAQDGLISVRDGLILLLLYLFYLMFLSRGNRQIFHRRHRVKKPEHVHFKIIEFLVGVFVLAQASQLVIETGVDLAVQLGVSQLIIGIILVGLGTSLPEMVVSIDAVLKGAEGLSVGNIVGSNIVNVTLALGASSLLGGWQVARSIINFDIPYLMFSSIVVMFFLLTRGKLERKESLLIFGIYAAFISLKLLGY